MLISDKRIYQHKIKKNVFIEIIINFYIKCFYCIKVEVKQVSF